MSKTATSLKISKMDDCKGAHVLERPQIKLKLIST